MFLQIEFSTKNNIYLQPRYPRIEAFFFITIPLTNKNHQVRSGREKRDQKAVFLDKSSLL